MVACQATFFDAEYLCPVSCEKSGKGSCRLRKVGVAGCESGVWRVESGVAFERTFPSSGHPGA